MDYEKLSKRLEKVSSPALLLDWNALDENIRRVANACKGKKVRIASKSIRCKDVLLYVLSRLENSAGVMAFHPSEALWLAQNGIKDILLGYPSMDALEIEAILSSSYSSQITFMVDHSAQCSLIEHLATVFQVKAKICIDVDMSVDYPGLHFGVFRSPIQNLAQLNQFLESIAAMKHLEIVGLMGYEAQIAGVGDQVPSSGLKSWLIRKLKKNSIPQIINRRAAMVNLLHEKAYRLQFVNGGGSGSMFVTSKDEAVTEITVGSAFFAGHLFDHYQGLSLQPALFFGLRIIRHPKPGIITAEGGGYMASGAIDRLKQPEIIWPPKLYLTSNEGVGEVQTPIVATKNNFKLQAGDWVFLRHAKSGELCERFNEIHCIENEKIVKTLATYRGEQKAFL
jgi:D-serine deaminase-like pyridoxal phosphate-dependent protein